MHSFTSHEAVGGFGVALQLRHFLEVDVLPVETGCESVLLAGRKKKHFFLHFGEKRTLFVTQ